MPKIISLASFNLKLVALSKLSGNILSKWGCFGKDLVFCFSTDWSKFSLNHSGICVVSATMPVTLHLKLNTIPIENENLKGIEIRRINNETKHSMKN